jgi:hypothetical protein
LAKCGSATKIKIKKHNCVWGEIFSQAPRTAESRQEPLRVAKNPLRVAKNPLRVAKNPLRVAKNPLRVAKNPFRNISD